MTASVVAMILGLALAFAMTAIAARHGARVAFGWCCWLPLGGLIAAVVLGSRLSYDVIAVLGAIVLASASLAGFGVVLTVRAFREGSAAARPLLGATLVAATPLLALAAMVALRALKQH